MNRQQRRKQIRKLSIELTYWKQKHSLAVINDKPSSITRTKNNISEVRGELHVLHLPRTMR